MAVSSALAYTREGPVMSNKIFTVMHEEYEPHPQISYILTSERGATLLKITQYVNAGDFHDYEKTAISLDWKTAKWLRKQLKKALKAIPPEVANEYE